MMDQVCVVFVDRRLEMKRLTEQVRSMELKAVVWGLTVVGGEF